MNAIRLSAIPAAALLLALPQTALPIASQQTVKAQSQQPHKAATFTVKGIVADSLTKEPEMYATMRIARTSSPDKAVSMAATGKDGSFNVKLKEPGDYTLTVNAIGRTPIVRRFTLSADKPNADFATLYISDLSKELKGVEIVAQKPLVKADIDKIEYNMEEDPDSKTSNILEMLRKVPMVTVDGNETITVNGSSNFKVYVNGRPNNMISNNPKEVLKSMPASSIKRIEVITNPGPKYDAEGVGGILNIITVGKGIEGYTATMNAGVFRGQNSESIYATVKQGKLTMSARYSYNYWDTMGDSNTHTDRTFTGDPSTPSAYNSTSDYRSRSNNNSHSGNFEASYEIDTLRLVTASIGMWTNRSKSHGTQDFSAVSPIGQQPLYAYAYGQNGTSDNLYIDGSIDYQRLFKVKERMLTLSYKINGGTQDSDSYSDYHDTSATDEWSDFMARLRDEHSKGDGRNMEHTFQIDYTTPFAKAHTIDIGAKYILRDNRANNDRYTRSADEADYTFDDTYSSHYRHRNNILAAYLGYGLKLGKLSGRLGARYEHTDQSIKYLFGQGENFKTKFDDIVPSASLGYKLNDEQSLRLGYNMRIWRPGIWALNPYLDQTNPTSLSQGNSNLVSEKNHQVSATYNYFAAKLSLSFTVRYSFTNNSINSVTTLVNDNTIESVKNPTGKLVSYTTYRNIGKSQSASLSGYVSWTIFKDTRLYMNLWGDYSDYNDHQSLHNYGWYGSMYAGLQQTLPKSWKINVGFSGWTSNPGLQTSSSGACFYNASVQKSFLKDRLTFNLFAQNFFESKRHSRTTTMGINFRTEQDYAYKVFRYGINVSMRIGSLSSGVKKAQKTIENDDVKGGGGK